MRRILNRKYAAPVNQTPRRQLSADRVSRSTAWTLLLIAVFSLMGCGRKSSKPTVSGQIDASREADGSIAGDGQGGLDLSDAVSGAKSGTGEASSDFNSEVEPLNQVAEQEQSGDSTAIGSADTGSAGMADSTSGHNDSPTGSGPAGFENATWTTKRLFALSPTGPCLIDLQVGINGKSLEVASQEITRQIADELFAELEMPVTWESLLEHRLVQSGWLGNLVAEEDQESQLVSMYDSDQDGEVGIVELGEFLSRGLARSEPMQVSDLGTAPDAVPNESPWGPVDEDRDYTLNEMELTRIVRNVRTLDFNGDSIVTLAEINSRANSTSDMAMNSMSMLDTSTMIAGPAPMHSDDRGGDDQGRDGQDDAQKMPVDQDDELRRREVSRVTTSLRDHYTFLDGIPREQWSRWSDDRWEQLDSDGDGRLLRRELETMLDMEPDVELQVMLPSLAVSADQELRSHASFASSQAAIEGGWSETDFGGRIQIAGFVAEVQVEDSYTPNGRKALRQQLSAALKDAQLQSFFTSQLQLQDGAFELVEGNEDGELDDEEFGRVWRWLTCRQGTRLLARWMVSPKPWFLVLDDNGDRRLSSKELQDSHQSIVGFDRNADGRVTPNELPLMVRLELRRSDNRLRSGAIGNVADQSANEMPSDWYSAMDSNGDGYVSRDEFLGEPEDFEQLDADADGFLVRSEVY